MPSFQPDPFGAGHVQQCSEDRFVTDANVPSEISVGQLRRRVHRELVGPFRVVEKMSDV